MSYSHVGVNEFTQQTYTLAPSLLYLRASCPNARTHYYDRHGWWKCNEIVWNNLCLPVGKKNGRLWRPSHIVEAIILNYCPHR